MSDTNRRVFLQTSAAVAATAALTPGAFAAGDDTLRVGLVGCGNRGTGAAKQALRADPKVKLVAMCDAFMDRLQDSLRNLKHGRDTRDIAAGMVANLALLPFLRYPVVLWPYGLAQCLHKVFELMLNGRSRDALAGLWRIPSQLWRHRSQRTPLTTAEVRSYLRLRRSENEIPKDDSGKPTTPA